MDFRELKCRGCIHIKNSECKKGLIQPPRLYGACEEYKRESLGYLIEKNKVENQLI